MNTPPEPLQVSTELLRTISDQLLRWLERTEGDTVTVGGDFFWTVARDEMFDMKRDPHSLEITVGELSYSKYLLEDLVAKNASHNLALVWLGELLIGVALRD